MSIASGSRLGPYEVVSRLGAGGMGEVYRARDTRLDRIVALKVLPPEIAHDETARARFEREARAISALNHPNICTLFDVGNENGVSYLVMELIEGQTLAELIARGPLSLSDAVRYAIEIATALDRAHRQGIVHRDLKPGNIMITKSGVKLLDFGLARLDQREPARHDAPTIAAADPITSAGMILGTLQYMSPEQLEGAPTDARTDIFSFGCILYEMVSGRRAFTGGSHASLITAIMSSEPPPLASLVPLTPLSLERLVKKCLAKSAEERWQSAGDLATELRWIGETPEVEATAPAKRRRPVLAWSIAALAIAAAIALFFLRRPAETPRVMRLSIPLDADRLNSSLLRRNVAVSPNGEWIVYTGSKDGKLQLWLRSLASEEASPIPHSDGATDPFWSPDSKQIAFFTGSKLMRIAISGDEPSTICDLPPTATVSGAWGLDGTILFSDLGGRVGLYRVPVTGGTPELIKLASLRPNGRPHVPQFIDDERFIYCDIVKGSDNHLHVHSLRSGEDRDLGPVESRLEIAGDTVVSVHDGTLIAQRIDRDLKRIGTPVVLASEVWNYRSLGMGEFSATQNVLVYATSRNESRATWFDRNGLMLGTVGPNDVRAAKLSRDGRKILITVNNPAFGTSDIWLADASRGSAVRLTDTPPSEFNGRFSPDGQTIAYSTELDGPPHIVMQSISGAAPRNVTPIRGIQYLTDWSPDGQFLVFRELDEKTNLDLWTVPARPDSEPVPLMRTPFSETGARLSPDGKHLSYLSNASGHNELYLAAIANPSDAVQVSTDGASVAAWSGDGRQLYYMTNDQRVFVADVRTTPQLDAATPKLLFRGTEGDWLDFDATPDGSRFLIVRKLSGPETRPLHAVINWQQLLAKR